MKIACLDGTVAAEVRATLARHGIVRGVHQTGPNVDDPTVWVIVNVVITHDKEPILRRDIESSAGATVE